MALRQVQTRAVLLAVAFILSALHWVPWLPGVSPDLPLPAPKPDTASDTADILDAIDSVPVDAPDTAEPAVPRGPDAADAAGAVRFHDPKMDEHAKLPLPRAIKSMTSCPVDMAQMKLLPVDGDCPVEGADTLRKPYDWHGVAVAAADAPLWAWEGSPLPKKARASWEVLAREHRAAHGIPLGIPKGSCPAAAEQPWPDPDLPRYLRHVGRVDAAEACRTKEQAAEAVKRSRAPPVGPDAWEAIPCITDAVLFDTFCGRGNTAPDLCAALQEYPFLRNMARVLLKGRAFPSHPTTIPVWGQLMFIDADHAVVSLAMIDVPVRQFVFLQNMDDGSVSDLLRVIRLLPWGVVVVRSPTYNLGYPASMNTIILEGFRTGGAAGPEWFMLANSDVRYPRGALAQFAYYANKHWEDYGLFYMGIQDGYAVGLSRRAVDKAGLFDEAYFPAYMEDVDYRWRIRLCGLGQIVTSQEAVHCVSVSLKRAKTSKAAAQLAAMKTREGRLNYARQKWGDFERKCMHGPVPATKCRTPFCEAAGKVPGADLPLSAWSLTAEHHACIVDHSRGRTMCPHDTAFLSNVRKVYANM